MIGYIGFKRVSTVKQGVQGVSLQEQHDAILRFASAHNLTVSIWLEEMETAAKRGRKVFNHMMTLLRQGKACGVIFHKLDRGARNLRDWTDVGDLLDDGIDVQFASGDLDLHTRGGRLAADIQAVVAADFIRNLREEAWKGFEGRLKQGIYPARASIGYLDQGRAKPKTIDPVQGPLVRETFELYATGQFSFETLGEEMFRRGLRNKAGNRVTRNGFSTILRNPFYIGINHIKKRDLTLLGIHEPLVSKYLFNRVQAVLAGKFNRRLFRHAFAYRRLIRCKTCHKALIGELQKGHIYYRCHTSRCAGTVIREEFFEKTFRNYTDRLKFTHHEQIYLRQKLATFRQSESKKKDALISEAKLRLGQVKSRLNALTDAYLDGVFDKSMVDQKRSALLMEQKDVEESLTKVRDPQDVETELTQFLAFASNLSLVFYVAEPEEKRRILELVTNRREANGRIVEIELAPGFSETAARYRDDEAGDSNQTAILDILLHRLVEIGCKSELPSTNQLIGSKKIEPDSLA